MRLICTFSAYEGCMRPYEAHTERMRCFLIQTSYMRLIHDECTSYLTTEMGNIVLLTRAVGYELERCALYLTAHQP